MPPRFLSFYQQSCRIVFYSFQIFSPKACDLAHRELPEFTRSPPASQAKRQAETPCCQVQSVLSKLACSPATNAISCGSHRSCSCLWRHGGSCLPRGASPGAGRRRWCPRIAGSAHAGEWKRFCKFVGNPESGLMKGGQGRHLSHQSCDEFLFLRGTSNQLASPRAAPRAASDLQLHADHQERKPPAEKIVTMSNVAFHCRRQRGKRSTMRCLKMLTLERLPTRSAWKRP